MDSANKDGDTMSGIEPLESSTATSALLQASPGSNISKLSLSFGSYHSSLQSSPKNPDQFRPRGSPRGPDMDVISPLHPQSSTQSSVLKHNAPSQPLISSIHHASSNQTSTTHVSSMPNTPFKQDPLPEESKRLMVSADEIMLREHNVKLHQYSNHHYDTQAPLHPTKRELFSNPAQSYQTSSYPAPNSTAYTSASRSYKSYDANGRSYDHRSHDQRSHDQRSHDQISHDQRSHEQRLHNQRSHDHRSHDTNLGSVDKPASYKGNSIEIMQPREQRTEFSSSSRSRSEDIGLSSVRQSDTHERKYLERNSANNPQLGPAHQEIAEMERVRESLHQMLNTSSSSRQPDSRSITPSELLVGAPSSQDKYLLDSGGSVKTDALLSARLYSDISPINVDSGFGLNAFKSFASNISQDVAETGRDPTLNAENHMLRDSLEKERFRRKHCEKQIADLQSKLLETQQQLAVAISTDKKKDAMIEQLDKTLARLVDGWKKQDQEKTEAIEQMRSHKDAVENNLKEMQKLYSKQTVEVNEVKSLLGDFENQNKLAIEEYESQISGLEQQRSSLTAQLQREQTRVQEVHAQHESVIDKSQRLQRELREAQQLLLQEKEDQHTAEETLQEQFKSFEQDQMEAINKEKAKADEQAKKAHEAVEVLTAVQRDVDKLKEQLECAVREKENSQLELDLQEARFEAGQRKQEAEIQENMEKTLNKRLTELQERAQHTESDLQESHRAQITDLQDQHQKEVDELRNAHHQETLQREKRLETLRQQYQERLEENQEELAKRNNKMDDVQHEKTLLVGKLQDVLQAYYSGTLTNATSQSATPTNQSQTSSPTPKHNIFSRDLIGNSLQHQRAENLPTTPARKPVLENQQGGTVFEKVSSKRDGLGHLSASQIASLHTTVHLQHKSQNHHQNVSQPNSYPNQHQGPNLYQQHHSHQGPSSYPQEIFHKSPMALSEHEISHVSRTTNNLNDISHVQNPLESSRTSNHAMQHGVTNTHNATPSRMHLFRDRGLLAGAQPIRLLASANDHAVDMRNGGVKVGDFYTGQASRLPDELATLEEDPDRSFGESFLDGRGYASGEFLPLKAVNSPTGSILSTGPVSESVSDLSSAPMYSARSNVMLLEKLAEHEQRQMALQHYIGMLLHKSPGASEEERITTNKPVDTSVVMKERLPAHKDISSQLSSFLNQRASVPEKVALDQQQPSRQKVVPNARYIPAERLQSKPTVSHPTSRSQGTTPGVNSSKGKTDNASKTQSSFSSRPSMTSKPSKPTAANRTAPPTAANRTAPSRQTGKGKVTRIQASHANEKRTGVESLLKRRGVKGKESR